MKVRWILVIFVLTTQAQAQNENIQFSGPDLSTPFMIANRRVFLDAYRVRNQTRWVSVGSPFIVGGYDFTPEAIWFNVRVLDDEQRQALVHAARQLHPNTPITESNFGIIPLQEFTCETKIFLQGTYATIRGEATDFHSTDIAVEVLYPESSEKRQALTARIKQNDRIVWKCALSAAGQVQRMNTLTVTSQQIQQVVQYGGLFGNGSEIYVTRNQMNQLAQRIRTELRVEEVYELEGEDFDRDFINRLIAMAPLQHVDVDQALSQLSKFGLNMDARDLSPNEIKREMSNKLEMKRDHDKKYIAVSDDTRREGSSLTGSSTDVNVRARVDTWFVDVGVDTSVRYAHTNANSWKNSDKSERQQLNELNRASHNHVQWEIEGNKIVPKTLNVAKLNRAAITRDLSFTILKTRVRDAQYKKRFNVLAAITNETSLDRMPLYDRLRTGLMRHIDDKIKLVQEESCGEVRKSCYPALYGHRQRTIYAGTFKGQLWISDDGGITWIVKRPLPQAAPIWSILAIGTKIYAGTLHGLRISNDNGQTWTKDHNFYTSNVTSVQKVGSKLYVVSDRTLYISDNDGDTWIAKNQLGHAPYMIGNKVYSASGTVWFTSLDGGNTWINKTIPARTGSSESIHKILVTPTKMYMATSDCLYVSDNNGQTWTCVIGYARSVFDVVTTNATIYAALGGGEYGIKQSVDDGKSWSQVDCGWGLTSLFSFALKATADRLYIGVQNIGLFAMEYTGTDPYKCWPLFRFTDTTDSVRTIFIQ